MGDILKEAIADAKAVRETALANAKMALEEAFTPQLKSMLSAKLREEDDEYSDEEDDLGGEEEIGDEELGGEEEEVPAEEGTYEDEEAGEEDFGGEEEPEAELGDEEDMEEEGLELEDIIRELESELSEEEGEADEPVVDETIEVNGIRYTPLKEEDEDEGEDVDGEEDDAEVEEESYEIDDSIIEGDEDEEDEEAVEEQSQSSGIGSGDNKVDVADANDEEDAEGGPGTAVNAMGESKVHAELAEYKEAVVFLKDKLHEVNILNAKLLFTNKLFKEFVLDNGQKMKVVETFDRAQTTREIKLVYSTLAEQFGDNSTIGRKKSLKESASAKSGSTKPSKESTKVISEENDVANRFRKLAGILKG